MPEDIIRDVQVSQKTYEDGTYKATGTDHLVLSEEETNQLVDNVRKVVAEGEISQHFRDIMLKYPEYRDIDLVNGEEVIRLYRAIPSQWEDAPTSPVFCYRPRERSDRENKEWGIHKLKQYLGFLREAKIGEEKFLKDILGGHLIDSIKSPFIPASISRQYVEGIYSGKGTKVIEMQVPLKYTFPLTIAKEEWLWGPTDDNFKKEQEVCIAGRVEPEWIVSVDEKT